MLIPRRVKHRKQHHPDRGGQAKGGTAIAFAQQYHFDDECEDKLVYGRCLRRL